MDNEASAASNQEEVVLSHYLDDGGIEMKIHNEFCDNLLKFGLSEVYVKDYRDSFDFDKTDINLEQDHNIQLESERFIQNVELEELLMMISEGVDYDGIPIPEEKLLDMESRVNELERFMNNIKSSEKDE